MTLVFEDHGQDFTEWRLDGRGKVIQCTPFQGSVWKGVVVLGARSLKAGDRITIRTKSGDVRRVNLRITEVRR